METSKNTKWMVGQNLGQIRSNVVKKRKKPELSIVFPHILHGKYILKQEKVVVQTHEYKFKAKIFRNATLKERFSFV